jgi:exopolyphosphatase/guanosine-5'-triphosphate,3'-diphosphate pyrophosphatase
VDRAEVTRLGEGLAKFGEIAPDAAERTAGAVADMSDEAKLDGVRAERFGG